MSEPGRVIVGFPSAQILNITGALEVFSTASRSLSIPRDSTELVSAIGGPVLSTIGLGFATDPIENVLGGVDTLVVSGGSDMDEGGDDRKLVDNIRRLASQSRRVTSVGSGAFLLTAAGLLDGRRATTHWAECADLDRDYPEVSVEPDPIYVRDGNVWTSAGITAGIDLALALVADDYRREAAATVARRLVVYLRRSGGQTQFLALLAAQSANDEPIPAMAAKTHLSDRQLSRVFESEVGITSAKQIEVVRMEAACWLLEKSSRSFTVAP